jgi:type IV secretion system protein VirD4
LAIFAQSLLVGVMLHVLYKARNEGKAATLPAVDALLPDPTAVAPIFGMR